ncbi:MAG TPA: C39 family peptidase [Parafilimonas sp.]|nr:C39 family peptidase [Parafilimonas sp.]
MSKDSDSIEISKFPLLKQETEYYCLPASLLAILKYHNNNLNCTQRELFHLMNKNPSFGAAKDISINSFHLTSSIRLVLQKKHLTTGLILSK